MNCRIAAVPFTVRNLKEDLEDLGSSFDGAPDLEFRHASKALQLERCGLSYQRIPPDYRFPYGHTHKESSVRPTSARVRAKTWRVGATGGLTSGRSILEE